MFGKCGQNIRYSSADSACTLGFIRDEVIQEGGVQYVALTSFLCKSLAFALFHDWTASNQ